MIDTNTKLCCIIGNPVEHSLSPRMHNAGYEALRLNFAYLAFAVTDVGKALAGLKEIGIKGISVTIPHKQTVMKYLDEIDETAQKIGAVNTIVNKNGKLCGTNTDWIGAVKALVEKTDLKGKRIALLGAGGAARAIAYGLKNKEAIVRIFSRNRQKAQKLVADFQLESSHLLDESQIISQSEVIINTTPVGMSPDVEKSPIRRECINSGQTVFDIVFAPKETKLLQYAMTQKAQVIYGYKMLLYQAIPQFELFTGKKAPVVEMEKALLSVNS